MNTPAAPTLNAIEKRSVFTPQIYCKRRGSLPVSPMVDDTPPCCRQRCAACPTPSLWHIKARLWPYLCTCTTKSSPQGVSVILSALGDIGIISDGAGHFQGCPGGGATGREEGREPPSLIGQETPFARGSHAHPTLTLFRQPHLKSPLPLTATAPDHQGTSSGIQDTTQLQLGALRRLV